MKDYIPKLTKQLLDKCKKQECNEVEAAIHLAAAFITLIPSIMAKGVKVVINLIVTVTPLITSTIVKSIKIIVRMIKLIYSKLCAGYTLLDHYIFHK